MVKLTLQDLSVNHDYYCSESNYHSNSARLEYATFEDFLEEFHDADVDMNLVFRWDLKDLKDLEEGEGHYLEIFQMKQRKGIFSPIRINSFEESDIPLLVEYLKPHVEKIKKIWSPFEF